MLRSRTRRIRRSGRKPKWAAGIQIARNEFLPGSSSGCANGIGSRGYWTVHDTMVERRDRNVRFSAIVLPPARQVFG